MLDIKKMLLLFLEKKLLFKKKNPSEVIINKVERVIIVQKNKYI
jgi:hypothetical protein